MTTNHLAALDLNLLVHLEALLVESQVTRAARRVGITQSAMSRSLARLRALLGDELLVRVGAQLVPTPRARSLAAPLGEALAAVEALLRERPRFDPASARRTFTVATADYGEALLLAPLLARLSREAPAVEVAVVGGGREPLAGLGGGEVDLYVGPRRDGPAGLVWRRLFHDGFVALVRRRHPVVKGRLTLARYLAVGHVLVAPGGTAGSALDAQLEARGVRRRVAVRVRSFLVVPELVAGSDLIGHLPERLARRAVGRERALELHRPPVELAGFDVELAWHERYRHDGGHQWFRELVAEVATGVGTAA